MDKTLFQQALLSWFAREKRDLPFRKTKNPYHIWISEVMAQQTRIEALLRYYERFIVQFPDVKSLAAADEDALMKAWQGLGYYSRARNLQKAALQCMKDWDGNLPAAKKDLCALAGIGDYTAGAIASIAYGEKCSAVDGNVIRVFARLDNCREFTDDPKVRKRIVRQVEESLPETDCGDYNQALMELGALVCQPGNPKCSICPVQQFCKGRLQEDVGLLPFKKPKKKRTAEQKEICIQAAWHEGQWWVRIRRRPEKGLLAGLYEFGGRFPQNVIQKYRLEDADHIFTHKEWHMQGWLVMTDWQPEFVKWGDLETVYALPSAFDSFYQEADEILKGDLEWINQ
ncbi:MAG: A/G-specific adenine glycosylase [Erysipelotrichaceae bacterium]|nr:A/G-specific adenine glycosylase [Erysipelotrichaceae bacterium]